jgi:hypothetical protein
LAWADPDTHGWVIHPADDSDWNDLIEEYAGDYPKPFKQVVATVRSGGCRTVVVENRYVDADYRSEYSAFWSLKFENQSPFARRLHFFAESLTDEQLHSLPDNPGYLGYSVLRPVPQGSVGRTVLAPPPELSQATLTRISDTISLFGNSLTVEGVPFCQQDGEYLRCAHAAAWMCHYSAYRNGIVGRHTTAKLVGLTPSMLSVQRALPSKGMTQNQLQAVFGGLGQPALFYGLSNLPQVRGVVDPEPILDEDEEPLPPGLWDTRMYSIICRYLNSGFPVLVSSEDHAFVLVGWFREGEEVHFVACDDQIGPYEIIKSPFDHYKAPWMSLMIPLPPKVFLSGESGENAGYITLLSLARRIPQLNALADDLDAGRLQLRSSLKLGSAYKDEIGSKTSSSEVLRTLRLSRLPRWVWIVEAHMRGECEADKSCVFAEAMYDSTSFDLSPRLISVSLPGVVAVYPPDEGAPVSVAGGLPPWPSLLTAH